MAKSSTSSSASTGSVGNGGNRIVVSDPDFVKINVQAHKEGRGIKWIAEQTGLKREYIQQRRATLRNRGVALPQLARGGGGGAGSKLDIDACNKLVAEITGQDPKSVAAASKALLAEAEKRRSERESSNAA